MAKAYWIAFYHSIKNPDALAARRPRSTKRESFSAWW